MRNRFLITKMQLKDKQINELKKLTKSLTTLREITKYLDEIRKEVHDSN